LNLSSEDRKNGSINQIDYFNGNCSHVSEIATITNNSESNLVSTTYYDTLPRVNKYSIRSWTHHVHHPNSSYNDSQMFEKFTQELNSQDGYNRDGIINTIPIITYHNFTNIPNMN
jgi:hypothetical protein